MPAARPALQDPPDEKAAAAAPRWQAFLLSAFLGWFFLLHTHPAPDWLDSPELISAAFRLGIFHPPGAPLAVLLGHLVSLWPFGPPGHSLLFFSALWGAVAAYLAMRISQLLFALAGRRDRWSQAACAPILGAALALSPGLTGQAVRTEVYTLGLVLLLASLRDMLAALTLVGDGSRAHQARLRQRAWALTGMGLAVHPLLALCAVPALLIFMGSERLRAEAFRPRALLRQGIAFLLGAAPLLLLPCMVHSSSDLRWGDPTTLPGFLAFASGATFSPSFGPAASPGGSNLLRAMAALVIGLGWPLLVLAVPGAWIALRRRPLVGAALLSILAASAATLLLQRTFRLDNPDVTGYLLPALFALGLLAAFGLAGAAAAVAIRSRVLADGGLALTVVLLLGLGWVHTDRPWGHGCQAGRAAAIASLQALPAHTRVLVSDFNLFFMLDYLQAVEGRRTDLALLYARDLHNQAFRSALERERGQALPAAPADGLPSSDELQTWAQQGPWAFDLGPHLAAGTCLTSAQPSGLLFFLDANNPHPARDPIAFYESHPAVCAAAAQRDPRTADVLTWHLYWQAASLSRCAEGARARALLDLAHCASPADAAVLHALAKHGQTQAKACPPRAPAAPPPIHGSQPPLGRALLLLLGMLLWAGALLGPTPAKRHGWTMALAGTGLVIVLMALRLSGLAQ